MLSMECPIILRTEIIYILTVSVREVLLNQMPCCKGAVTDVNESLLHNTQFSLGSKLQILLGERFYTLRIHLTTGESGTTHGQAIRTGFIKGFVLVQQIHTIHTNSLMKPVRIA